jgi:hypothetical protein
MRLDHARWPHFKQEISMAKGQTKSNKEAKKPKADKNQSKSGGSAYKQGQTTGGQSALIAPKKS